MKALKKRIVKMAKKLKSENGRVRDLREDELEDLKKQVKPSSKQE